MFFFLDRCLCMACVHAARCVVLMNDAVFVVIVIVDVGWRTTPMVGGIVRCAAGGGELAMNAE